MEILFVENVIAIMGTKDQIAIAIQILIKGKANYWKVGSAMRTLLAIQEFFSGLSRYCSSVLDFFRVIPDH